MITLMHKLTYATFIEKDLKNNKKLFLYML